MKIDTEGTWFPSFLPDGRHFLFFTPAPTQPENAGVFVASLDSSTAKRLVTARSRAVHAPGYLLFWREGALLAQAFDETTLEVRGNPVSVANAVGLNPVTNQGLFSVSDSGTLVFFAGAVGESELVWFDRAGRRIGNPGPKGVFNSLSLSPEATSVVYDQAEPRNRTFDLWRLDFARGIPSRLTFHPSHDIFPLWSPDGTRIAFSSLREPPPQLYELNANSAGTEKLLLKTNLPKSRFGVVQRREVTLLRQHRSSRPAETSGLCPWSASPSRIRLSARRPTSTTARSRPTDGGWRTSRTRQAPTRCTSNRFLRQDSSGRFRRRAASSRSGDVTAKSSSTWRPIRR